MHFGGKRSTSIYEPTFWARGLFVSLLIPFSVIAIQWRAQAAVVVPEFMGVWVIAWLISLLVAVKIPMRRWTSVGFHWLLYLGASSLLVYEWAAVYLLQAIVSSLWWGLFDAFERTYANYKTLNEAITRAKILEARIRPHFMFNVLNNLRALSPDNSIIAKGLEDSAELLRAALGRTNVFVDYCEERSLVEQYLRLESLRLDARLQVEWQVDEDVEDYNPKLPGFILQPIVENAIRHGIELHGGSILISLKHVGSYLVIDVKNNLSKREYGSNKHYTLGLGLAEKDIIQRLGLLYDSHASYDRFVVEEAMVVTIKLPWAPQ